MKMLECRLDRNAVEPGVSTYPLLRPHDLVPTCRNLESRYPTSDGECRNGRALEEGRGRGVRSFQLVDGSRRVGSGGKVKVMRLKGMVPAHAEESKAKKNIRTKLLCGYALRGQAASVEDLEG